MNDPGGAWGELPEPIRNRVDAAIRRRQDLQAMVVLCHEQPGLRLGLVQAQELVAFRFERLADLGEVEPNPVVQLADLRAAANAITERVVAVEALWDGDTQGWHVILFAIVERASTKHARFDEVHLATLRMGTDLRVFNGQVLPWPEANIATDIGASLALGLQVPFYFYNPDSPGIDQPRWWDALT